LLAEEEKAEVVMVAQTLPGLEAGLVIRHE
jgi:hypothetical protein